MSRKRKFDCNSDFLKLVASCSGCSRKCDQRFKGKDMVISCPIQVTVLGEKSSARLTPNIVP